MPKNSSLRKVMVIGSGPIIIGQAAEFDYAGTQACQALKEEGLYVVLLNSNPATIMTDSNIADRVYIQPLTPEVVEDIIAKERPDGLLPTLGGQVGLNLAFKVAEMGILDKYNVQLLGTSLEAIKKAEDREIFKATMEKLGQPIPESVIVSNLEEAREFAQKTGYPLIVRPAYTLGGTGGGVVNDDIQLKDIIAKGLKHSIIGQVLLEKSIAGWKEIEYEVMRDSADNCITICNMENVDAVGVHTGDSIVVAPTQTLTVPECQMLRTAALDIISELGIEGGCNVQFALDTDSRQYYVIEVNPRVSRSSALASKATGYPIAKVATKIAIGYQLDEIKNAVTQTTMACFEPTIDYIVVKFPRWPFDKFAKADRTLGTQMKATGEVMAMDRTFEAALLKALRSLEIGIHDLQLSTTTELSPQEIRHKLENVDDERIFVIAEALRWGISIEEIYEKTKIDRFFLEKINNIIKMEFRLCRENLTQDLLIASKKIGFADKTIADLTRVNQHEVRQMRKKWNIYPCYKMVDTCAAEFEAVTPYFYSTYAQEDEVIVTDKPKVIVLGSGPIRIGQGVEFDYCSVHSVWALRALGFETIIINNNPETVSTDFDVSDRLYFEPLILEDVLNIIEKENPIGVIVQFGGQTAINLAEPLAKAGIKIIGTSVDDIDSAENREKFDALLEELLIERPVGASVTNTADAIEMADKIGYPVVVRPSYVLGGRAMEIVYNDKEINDYMTQAVKASPEHPVLIDRYMQGIEVEVDAISDGEQVLIPGIMEHIERAGVHSGDSISIYPPRTLSELIIMRIVSYTEKLSLGLKIKGLINIQYVVMDERVYVLEVNPRSSRSVPFLSKVTHVPMVDLATRIAMGEKLADMGYGRGLLPEKKYWAIKAPVFSFAKMQQVDIGLGPEMKSTGEVMGIDPLYEQALYLALTGAGLSIPDKGTILFAIADRDKHEAGEIAAEYMQLGYELAATTGTAKYLNSLGLLTKSVDAGEGSEEMNNLLRSGQINMVINTITRGKQPGRDGFKLRRSTVELGIPCLTSIDTAREVIAVSAAMRKKQKPTILAMQDYETK